MEKIEIKGLLEAGVHLGHKRYKWNPKMESYIYCEKDGNCIINLAKTAELLEKACTFLKEAASKKKSIIFLGTKKHISEIIKEEAIRCGAFYINRRWLGGFLTNFDTIRHRLNRLRELEEMQESGTLSHTNKKELVMFNKELEKLQKTLGGIKNMRGKPDVIFVVDQQKEHIAIKEAIATGIKVVAIVDTNCNPEGIDFPIPGNDDSVRSVKYITKAIADSIIDGYEGIVPDTHRVLTVKESFTKRLQDNMKTPAKIVEEVTIPKEEQEISS